MIYSLTYYFIYEMAKVKNPNPRLMGAVFVFLLQLIHFMFLYVVFRSITGITFDYFVGLNYGISKGKMMPFAFLWMLLVHLWYRKRFQSIKKKFSDKDIMTRKNGILILSSFLVPLIISILISEFHWFK